jgi:hypothetical protein
MALNFVKTNYKSVIMKTTCLSLYTGFHNKLIEEVEADKFIRLNADNKLN